MIEDGAPIPDGWRDAPLLAAVTFHRAAKHPGQVIGCPHPECRERADAALATEAERLPVRPWWPGGGRLIPG